MIHRSAVRGRAWPVAAGLASDAIRGGLERHFGVKLAFQNCHGSLRSGCPQ